MFELRVTIGLLLTIVGAFFTIVNWICVIEDLRIREHERRQSPVPVVSLLLVAFGYLIRPHHHWFQFHRIWWIVLIPLLDIGTWKWILGLIMEAVRQPRSRHHRPQSWENYE